MAWKLEPWLAKWPSARTATRCSTQLRCPLISSTSG